MDPHDVHVQYRINALREEAAGRRLMRRAEARPGAEGGGGLGGRVGRPVRALAMAIGFVLVRIGVALGASPLDNV